MASPYAEIISIVLTEAFFPPLLPVISQFLNMTRDKISSQITSPCNQTFPLTMLSTSSGNSCNTFWPVIGAANKFNEDVTGLWKFRILREKMHVGYMHEDMVKSINWANTSFVVDFHNKEIHLLPEVPAYGSAARACQEQFILLLEINRHRFHHLSQWKQVTGSLFPIACQGIDLAGVKMPAPMRGMFGIVTYGIHLNIYSQFKGTNGEPQPFAWVSKRSVTTTFPGMFDQVVAGGFEDASVLDPLIELQREAQEEAGLTLNLPTRHMEKNGTVIGTVTGPYLRSVYDRKDHRSRKEDGHLEPGVRFVFDLEADDTFIPEPNSEDIDSFILKSVEDIKKDLLNLRWKPNSGLAKLASLIRHGFINQREASIDELLGGLQRPLPFPIAAARNMTE